MLQELGVPGQHWITIAITMAFFTMVFHKMLWLPCGKWRPFVIGTLGTLWPISVSVTLLVIVGSYLYIWGSRAQSCLVGDKV